MSGHELRAVATASDWASLHTIRRATLFAPGFHNVPVVYDEDHPDDRAPGHTPFLLLQDGAPIGVVRLDLRGDVAVVRLVAIVPELQERGHGRMLDRLVVDEARRRGVAQLRVNAAASAVGFYEKTGWSPLDWDPAELTGIASGCVQMAKPI